MTTTKDINLATKFDRFSTDVNLVFKRLKKTQPNLRKTKLLDRVLGADVYVFWFCREENTKEYIVL